MALALRAAPPEPPTTAGAPDEALLRQLIQTLAPPPRHSALPTLAELAEELPQRLPPPRVAAIRALSPQLRVVLDHLGEGRDNDDIAYRMRLSKDTIESHCKALRERLSLRTRAELMALAGLLACVRDGV